jgi:hypothetical protein
VRVSVVLDRSLVIWNACDHQAGATTGSDQPHAETGESPIPGDHGSAAFWHPASLPRAQPHPENLGVAPVGGGDIPRALRAGGQCRMSDDPHCRGKSSRSG